MFGWGKKAGRRANDLLQSWALEAVQTCSLQHSSADSERIISTLIGAAQSGQITSGDIGLTYPLLNLAIAYWDDRLPVHQALLHHFGSIARQHRDAMLSFCMALIHYPFEIVLQGGKHPAVVYNAPRRLVIDPPVNAGYYFREELEERYRKIVDQDFEGPKQYPISRFFAAYGAAPFAGANWQRQLVRHWICAHLLTEILDNQENVNFRT